MLVRDRRAADAVALEAGAFDQLRRMAARRIREHRAAAPGADRLARVALLEEPRIESVLASGRASKRKVPARNHSPATGGVTLR